MTRALITGAYGFIGRHVARALAADSIEVRAIGHGGWGRDEWRSWGIAEWHLADVTIESLTTYGGEPDFVVHCAGSGSVGFSVTHPYQDYQRTVATTHTVLEYIRVHRPDTGLVFPSSAGVYGVAASMPIRVDDALNPASPYGLHKRVAEDLCRSYGRHFGVKSAIVRLFSIYGVGLRKQLLWDTCSKITAVDLMFSGTGAETRDWLHIEDAAALLACAARHASAACPVVNGGTGLATPVSKIIEAIARDLGVSDSVRFSGVARPGDPIHYLADITQALAWGWAPTREWRDEIGAYVQWFRDGAN